QEKKIFAVQGPYPVIRSLLRARGWVEKKLSSTDRLCGQRVLHKLEEKGSHEEEEEKEEKQCDEDPEGIHNLMSRLVRNQMPYFIWTNTCSAINHWLLQHDQVLNHYTRAGAITTKVGLCLNLRNLPWFEQADPHTFFPRCYVLEAKDEWEDFTEDFHLTAARNLLKIALERGGDTLRETEQPLKCSERPGSPLPPQLVEKALQVCEQHLARLEHQDIDGDSSPYMTSAEWDCFLQDYYRVAHEGAGLVLSRAQRERGQALLQCLAERLPQLHMEGDRNVWILKPGAKSRGRGIVCTARLDEVVRLTGGCPGCPATLGKWVVQKYIERPLLIFGTKFDIRQWFLVTDWNPLTIWFYKESYLRFCSQPFCLCHLDCARHLCNVSIQKHCRPAQGRPPQLPPDHIWSCHQLQAYLAQVGRADAWHQVMVPGMKAAVVGALRSAQEQVGSRKGSFELYGADFLFGEDCQPWLLEINASPTMVPSSVVTSRLCARVQQDTLRVVIDHKHNPTCPTGAFELIYKE
ncbi:TTLL3 monoglycylase, partial [Upupa epops]|nr:TTLL3 monoglycylase [Upupa epops]